ncbi:hypothetical protein Taro_020494 [Colocasia esculenta]|uniref:Uncharacterized protein n=1 Tax=Colocasia esculenta TaxID=4460 RepID=A0A843V8N5_COLES|nr:hypothetical protein [Colocasia esculenta]
MEPAVVIHVNATAMTIAIQTLRQQVTEPAVAIHVNATARTVAIQTLRRQSGPQYQVLEASPGIVSTVKV